MSWEAVTWANKQRLKKSYEQIVLLVLANAADPNGEAFVKWPGRDHWWQYLSDLTRLPKSSLFRHLNTLMALGLGERSMLVLHDGTRRPTFKLNMHVSFDIDNPEDAARYNAIFAKASSENESPVETENHDDETGDENASDISASHGTETPIAPQSPVETGNSDTSIPSPETGSFPVLRLHRDSKSFPKDSPLPPSGGLPARDELWDQFVASWGEPIPKMAIARSAWDHAGTAKRPEIVTACRGYWAWLKAHPKPPTALSAQSFIRNSAGWAQWLRYAPDASGSKPATISTSYPVGSHEGRAIIALHELAGVGQYLRDVKIHNGAVSYRNPITPQLLALADLKPRSEWTCRLSRRGAGAWNEFIRNQLGGLLFSRLAEGFSVPEPFPPLVDGTWSPNDNNEDLEALSSEGQR